MQFSDKMVVTVAEQEKDSDWEKTERKKGGFW